MLIRKANIEDINTLIQIRIDFLREEAGNLSIAMEEVLRVQLASYISSHLNRDLYVFLAEQDERIVSTVFLSMIEKIPNTHFQNGRAGMVHNVYTYPDFRRSGLATALLHVMITEVRQLEISAVDLIATPDGKPLYEKVGFERIKDTFMRLRLTQ